MINIGAITKASLHEETIIGSVLSHLHGPWEAQRLSKVASEINPIVSFGRKSGSHIAYGQEITESCLEHVRIKVNPKDTDPYRYFRRIAAHDGTTVTGQARGFNASAWVETDAHGIVKRENGTCNLRLCYPGYTHSTQTESMLATFLGEFRQAREVGPFVDRALAAAKAMEIPVGGVVNTSWSMGAANALASNLYFKHRGIPTAALLGDAWRSSAAVQNIAMRSEILLPLFNGNHAEVMRYSQPRLRKMLVEDVISVYPAVKNQAGVWTRPTLTAPDPGRFPIAERLGLLPFGVPVGQTFNIDVSNMQVLERLSFMGDAHHRANIINHLATKGPGVFHEIPRMAAAKSAGPGLM